MIDRGGTAHEDIGARVAHQAGIVKADVSVALDLHVTVAPLIQKSAQTADLIQGLRDQLLPRKARIDGHHKNPVHVGKDLVQHRKRCCGVQGNHCLGASCANRRQNPLQMAACLNVHAHVIPFPEIKPIRLAFGIRDHQMEVQWDGGCGADLFDKVGTQGLIGDEDAVHHVNVKVFDSAGLQNLQLLVLIQHLHYRIYQQIRVV